MGIRTQRRKVQEPLYIDNYSYLVDQIEWNIDQWIEESQRKGMADFQNDHYVALKNYFDEEQVVAALFDSLNSRWVGRRYLIELIEKFFDPIIFDGYSNMGVEEKKKLWLYFAREEGHLV